jgi:putative ABC transport system permease protein
MSSTMSPNAWKNTIRRFAIQLLVFVIMIIAGLGIANTVIMAAYERIREIGTLLALGMRKKDVATLFLLEGGIMGTAAGLVGAAVGVVVVKYVEKHGWILPGDAMSSMKDLALSSAIYTKFQLTPVLVALGYSAVVAVAASTFPARFAANLVPADAVRAD